LGQQVGEQLLELLLPLLLGVLLVLLGQFGFAPVLLAAAMCMSLLPATRLLLLLPLHRQP